MKSYRALAMQKFKGGGGKFLNGKTISKVEAQNCKRVSDDKQTSMLMKNLKCFYQKYILQKPNFC